MKRRVNYRMVIQRVETISIPIEDERHSTLLRAEARAWEQAENSVAPLDEEIISVEFAGVTLYPSP